MGKGEGGGTRRDSAEQLFRRVLCEAYSSLKCAGGAALFGWSLLVSPGLRGGRAVASVGHAIFQADGVLGRGIDRLGAG